MMGRAVIINISQWKIAMKKMFQMKTFLIENILFQVGHIAFRRVFWAHKELYSKGGTLCFKHKMHPECFGSASFMLRTCNWVGLLEQAFQIGAEQFESILHTPLITKPSVDI